MEEQAKPMTPNEGRLAVLEAEYSLSPVRTRMEEQAIDLPEPFVETDAKVNGEWGHFQLYTADQVRAAVLAERERCARVCDEVARNDTTCMGDSTDLRKFASAIRSGLPSSPAT